MVFFKEAEEQANQSLVIETRTLAASPGHGMNLLERGTVCSFSPIAVGAAQVFTFVKMYCAFHSMKFASGKNVSYLKT